MKHYSEAAVERAMKIQEVILRAVAGKLQWWQAAEIVRVSCRTMRRWRWMEPPIQRVRWRPYPNRGILSRSRKQDLKGLKTEAAVAASGPERLVGSFAKERTRP